MQSSITSVENRLICTHQIENDNATYQLKPNIHSDWGFDPKTLPSSPKRKVLIATGKGNKIAHMEMSTYLVESYPNAEIQILNGGHIAAFFEFDEIIKNWLTNLDKEFNDRTQIDE